MEAAYTDQSTLLMWESHIFLQPCEAVVVQFKFTVTRPATSWLRVSGSVTGERILEHRPD